MRAVPAAQGHGCKSQSLYMEFCLHKATKSRLRLVGRRVPENQPATLLLGWCRREYPIMASKRHLGRTRARPVPIPY